MGTKRGLVGRLQSLARRRTQVVRVPVRHDLELIHSELRRARRYRVPFAIAAFRSEHNVREASLHEVARGLQAELREFDYVVVDDERGTVSLWMFGTPREGAQLKIARIQASWEGPPWLATGFVGIAAFPQDGMTYEALVECALGQTGSRVARQDMQAEDGRVAWQPNVQGVNTQSTS